MCWELNIALPNTFDFIVFGSHAASLHSAVPAFMGICSAFSIALHRDKIEKEKGQNAASVNTNKENYIEIFKNLLLIPAVKEKMGFKKCFLQLSDFLLDDDTDKFYSLIPKKDALLVTRDPISVLKAVCALQNRPKFMLLDGQLFDAGINFSLNPYEYFDKHYLKYQNHYEQKRLDKKAIVSTDKSIFSQNPELNENKLKNWLLDRAQTFHDAQVFRLLKNSIYRLKIKLTSDFIQANETMKDLSEFFDLDFKESPLYNERVSDLKYFTPQKIYANANMALFDELACFGAFGYTDVGIDAQKRLKISKNEAQEAIILNLSTQFDRRNLITAKRGKDVSGDITEYFSGLDSKFIVYLENSALKTAFLNDEILLKKARKYVLAASKAILDKAKNEKQKLFKESDILNFLAKNKDLRDLARVVFHAHLGFLREYKPEIISSFKYYNEFLKLCENDGKINFCDEYKDEIENMKKIGLGDLILK